MTFRNIFILALKIVLLIAIVLVIRYLFKMNLLKKSDNILRFIVWILALAALAIFEIVLFYMTGFKLEF